MVDVATAQQAAAQAKDYRGSRLRVFDPLRDIGSILGWWDANVIGGTNGSAVAVFPDSSGNANDLSQSSAANRPTLVVDALGTRDVLRFGNDAMIGRSTFGSGWPGGQAYPMPFTMFMLAKVASSVRSADQDHALFASGANMLVGRLTGVLSCYGTSGGSGGGPNIADDAWHTLSVTFDTGSTTCMTDGYVVGLSSGTGHGTPTMTNIGLGGSFSGNDVGAFDYAEGGIFTGRPTLTQLSALHAAISKKWGI